MMGCLSGIGLVFGNITNNNVLELTEVASRLGATILGPSEASRASYLVASNVLRLPDGSDPYLVCIQLNPSVVVVSTDWLSQCQAEQRQVPPQAYRLMPFSGIKVSITNFGAKERDGVVSQLKQGGATYSPELFRHTSHLVGNRPGGNKYTHAKDWGIFIVHYDWVVDCLKAGYRLDEKPYNLDAHIPAGPALAANLELQRQPSRTVSSTRMPAPSSSGVADGNGAPGVLASGRHGASASIRGVVPPGAGPGPTGFGGPGALTHGGSLADDASGGGGKGVLAQPSALQAAPPGSVAQADQFYIIPAVPPDDCYFLHWVRLWVVGCTSSEQSHVLAAVRESGATREPVLSSAVTHIVFGSVLSTADLAEVRQHLAEHREQVKLARLSWLYECVNRRAYVEPEGPYAMTVAQLLLAQGGVGTGSLVPAQGGRGVGQRSREGSPALLGATLSGSLNAAGGAPNAGAGSGSRLVAPLDDYVPLDPDGNTRTMDGATARPPGASGVFSGLWFTLVAVAGTEEEATATKLVRQGGGMIMSATTEKSVRDPQRRYAVCPFSLPQPALDRICGPRGRDRGPSEFERVPPEQRITVAWLRACVARGELLPVKRETPLFRPLAHALPLPRFQGVVVAVSQYHIEQREVLEELISRLGGTYTEKLNKRCHYLVIQEARGDKFTHALKWGIPCVRADWVLESAYAGRPLDDQIAAFLPTGITPTEMEERRAAAAHGGGGGIIASQLGPTQRPASQLPGTMPTKGPQGSSQCETEGRPVAAAAGLPPRPSQAPDRRPSMLPLGTTVVAAPAAAFPPTRGVQHPMAPPPAPIGREAPTQAPVPSAAAKPPSVLQPLINAILGDDDADGEVGGLDHPPTTYGLRRPDAQPSGSAAAAPARSALQACNPPYGSAGAQALPPGTHSAADQASAHGDGGPATYATPGPPGSAGTSSSAACGGTGPAIAPAPPDREPEAALGGEANLPGAEAAGPSEHDGATAMLMQFLDSNKFVPELACSQLDLPMPMPMPAAGPLGAEGSHAAATSSMSSRDLGTSVVSFKSTDDGGGGVAGRRSRKRAAAAAVGDAPAPSGKLGTLPGRRGRADEEDEGFGTASQQVGYEAATAAPPPRTTRSASRGGRGAVGTAAKEKLIKAVQGNAR